MSKPLVVSIPHSLGKEEAIRRLQSGFGQLRSNFGDKIATLENTRTGDRMDFRAGALGQTITGHLEVMVDSVRLEVHLPLVFALFAEKAKSLIQKQGALMLEKK